MRFIRLYSQHGKQNCHECNKYYLFMRIYFRKYVVVTYDEPRTGINHNTVRLLFNYHVATTQNLIYTYYNFINAAFHGLLAKHHVLYVLYTS
jgi:hypothetical protein